MRENGDNTASLPTYNKSALINLGLQINVDNVDTINTKNNFICLNCNKKNPMILAISNTFTFVLGSFLDKLCCCATSVTPKALLVLVSALLVVGATIGGVLGKQLLNINFVNKKNLLGSGLISSQSNDPQDQTFALIVTGGFYNISGDIGNTTAASIDGGITWCPLPNLPDDRSDHTQSGLVLCGGEKASGYSYGSCLTFIGGVWSYTHTLRTNRSAHSAWSSLKGILLIGGDSDNGNSTEILEDDGHTTESFDLEHYIYGACVIQLSDKMILTGGYIMKLKLITMKENCWKICPVLKMAGSIMAVDILLIVTIN